MRPDILDNDAVVPPAFDVTPGWVARNRGTLETGRRIGRALMVVAPPPARLALGAVSLAADAALMIDEYGRGRGGRRERAGAAAALTLEAVALAAMSRLAPARLAASLGGIEAARAMLARLRAR